MTTTSATSSSSAASTAASLTASNPYASLGAADYMKLLTTEMQNQDPTAPVDQTQMIAQMAGFSQLQGITDMNSTLSTMSTTLNSILAAQKAAGTTTSTTTTGSTTSA